MIEKIGILVSGILGLIKKGQFQEASQSIEDAYQDVLKEDAAYFNKIPLNKLTHRLIREHYYTNGHLEILSELFYAQAELSYAEGNQKNSLQFYQKSLMLLEFVMIDSRSYSVDKQTKSSFIQKRIAELNSRVS